MNRTFNYTKRRRIEQQHVNIRVVEKSSAGVAISVTTELTDYQFPIDSDVFLEVSKDTAFERHILKHPFEPRYSERLNLIEILDTTSVRFDLRVVEPHSDGRLLGLAAQIPLVNPSDLITEPDALLAVEWGNTGQEVWQLEIQRLDGPKLTISEKLRNYRERIAGDPMFYGCILPQVFRNILEFSVLDDDFDPDDDDSWFNEWLRWMSAVPELRHTTFLLTETKSLEDRERWINDTVAEFAAQRSNRFTDAVARTIAGG